MEYATLGNTGLLVSKLCFGTMTFGDVRGLFKGISAVGQAGADELDSSTGVTDCEPLQARANHWRLRPSGYNISSKPE